MARRVVVVDDPRDPSLSDYVSLRDSQLRRSLETSRGMFIAEGEKIIRRAAEAGCRARSFLLQDRWLDGLSDVVENCGDAPVYVGSAALVEQVSGFHVHRGALAAFERPPARSWEDVLAGDRIMVCQDLVDHTNMGSILRVAAALGWDAVVVSQGSADPLYRRAIKASMGASLQLPWRRMDHDGADLQRIHDAGFHVVATALVEDAVALENFRPRQRVALLLGTEGHGLSADWIAAADVSVQIPMAEGIDSLNVATAAAICGWALRSSPPAGDVFVP
ncbi:TrmH family RNA methyltransferase [Tessaracoccus antarcticus]|uniref:RNA methyltransferase n=1 Tax=Tessaracoccus antarcticus TaxID=2479848 RepID=A0A3M0GR49_9ACTN|nr:RNA methyltransferase [Tessaracoccus antarcticus]RMB59756.1 RNA methyltransferase [Tessaracoccus antarcticus]